RVARGAEDELVIFQRVDEAGVAGDDCGDEGYDAVEHDVQRIRGGDAAGDFVEELKGVEAVAEAGHGGGGLRDAADGGGRGRGFCGVARLRKFGFEWELTRNEIERGTSGLFALSAQHIAGVLGGFIDEEAEFGTRGLEVRRDAVVLHLRGGGGADGDDDDGTQAADQGGDAVHLLRDHHQVNDLDGGGEEDDIDFSVGDAVDTFAQRFEVVRQRPLI